MNFLPCSGSGPGQIVAVATVAAPTLQRIERRMPDVSGFHPFEARYCLLAFGAEASSLVWLVLDGDTLHVFRGGNREKRVLEILPGCSDWLECVIGDHVEADSQTKHSDLKLVLTRNVATLTMRSDGWGMKDFSYLVTNLVFSSAASDAPIVHFHGPLQFRAYLTEDGPPYLLVEIGIEGVGDGAFASISKSVSEQISARPSVDIFVRAKDDSIVQQHVVLTYEHCVDGFHGSVRVPPGIGIGNVELTVTFADWLQGDLHPMVLEIPLSRLEWRAFGEVTYFGDRRQTKKASLRTP